METAPLKTVEVQTEYLDYFTRKYDHELEMLSTRKKEIADVNPESPPRTHPATNIREVLTLSWTVFTQKHNELIIEQVIQCSQDVAGDELHFSVLDLNKSSTEEDKKKAYRSLAR